jgi:ADP-heptose:LPS heptosyltransferase
MHLAAAVGLPVLVLEGPQDAARTGPWPPPDAESPHRVVRAADEPRCAPCFARRCTHAAGPVCMIGLDPARVAAACLRAR